MFTFTEHGTWKTVMGTGVYVDVRGDGAYRVLGTTSSSASESPLVHNTLQWRTMRAYCATHVH